MGWIWYGHAVDVVGAWMLRIKQMKHWIQCIGYSEVSRYHNQYEM